MRRALLMLALTAALAGCGTRQKLRPLPGMGKVPKAAEARAPETPIQLMTPKSQARPARSADLLTKSDERHADPFDLPPGPDNGKHGVPGQIATTPPPSPQDASPPDLSAQNQQNQ